jgi:hypothetical protein
MALSKEEKLEAIAARRGPLLHEQYAAELDVKVAEEGGIEALMEEPKARLARVNSQLGVLDEEESNLD